MGSFCSFSSLWFENEIRSMNYRDFQLDDFLKDEYFVGWVKNPNAESDYFWNNWTKQNPGNKAIIEKATRIVRSIESPRQLPTEKEVNEVLERILNQIDKQDRVSESRRLFSNFFYKAAAVVLLAVSSYFIVYRFLDSQNVVLGTAISHIEKSTQKGQKLNFQLSDGTHVKLNAESRLVVSEDFGLQQRVVSLEGEAFFQVAKDSSKPFIINTKNLKTRVLGTSFNINAYRESEKISVAVETGAVEVTAGSSMEPGVLSAGQMLTFNTMDVSVLVSQYNKQEVLGWKDNLIYFENADFMKIQKRLERWYGIEFTFGNGISPVDIQENFTGAFKNTSLERVLDALSYTSKYEYELYNNNKVHVKPKSTYHHEGKI